MDPKHHAVMVKVWTGAVTVFASMLAVWMTIRARELSERVAMLADVSASLFFVSALTALTGLFIRERDARTLSDVFIMAALSLAGAGFLLLLTHTAILFLFGE